MIVPGASQSGVRAWAVKVTRHAECLGLMHPVLCIRQVLNVAKGTPSKNKGSERFTRTEPVVCGIS